MDKWPVSVIVYGNVMEEVLVKNAFVTLRLCEKNLRKFLSGRTNDPVRDEESLIQDFRFLVHCLVGGTMEALGSASLKYLTFLDEVIPCPSFYNNFIGDQGPFSQGMPQYLSLNKEEYYKGLDTAKQTWLYEIGPEFFKAFIKEEPPILIKPYPFGNAVAKLHNELLNAVRACNRAFLSKETYFQFMEQMRVLFRPPYTAAVESTIN